MDGYEYIIWKVLKNPSVGTPIVAVYTWILTHFLKEFYSNIFAIDFKSLFPLIPVEDYINDLEIGLMPILS